MDARRNLDFGVWFLNEIHLLDNYLSDEYVFGWYKAGIREQDFLVNLQTWRRI